MLFFLAHALHALFLIARALFCLLRSILFLALIRLSTVSMAHAHLYRATSARSLGFAG